MAQSKQILRLQILQNVTDSLLQVQQILVMFVIL